MGKNLTVTMKNSKKIIKNYKEIPHKYLKSKLKKKLKDGIEFQLMIKKIFLML